MAGILSKEFILSEIRRLAAANGGVAIGRERFARETGIHNSDVERHWVRWSEAIRDAGYDPNPFTRRIEDAIILDKLAELTRGLGHFPVQSELRMRARKDASFPSHTTLTRVGGGLGIKLAAKLRVHCEGRPGYEDVLLLLPATPIAPVEASNRVEGSAIDFGFVYLMKAGKHYKIGRSNRAGRREYELAIQLPEALRTVHRIQTDDPKGSEEYWHSRFATKRKNGEWFDLDAADVAAFRRRKFM